MSNKQQFGILVIQELIRLYTLYFYGPSGALKLSSVYLDWGGVLKKLKLFKMWNKFNEDLYLLLKKLRLQSFKTISLFSYIFHRRSMYFILLLFFAFPLCKANACSCCCCLSFWHIDICIFIVCHDLWRFIWVAHSLWFIFISST